MFSDQDEWGVAIFPRKMEFKWNTHTEPLIRIEASTGRVYFGPGDPTAPAVYMDYLAAGALDGIEVVDGCIKLHVHTDATRGAAGTAGRIIFNSTDGQLNIDDGTNWTLPSGTTT